MAPLLKFCPVWHWGTLAELSSHQRKTLCVVFLAPHSCYFVCYFQNKR